LLVALVALLAGLGTLAYAAPTRPSIMVVARDGDVTLDATDKDSLCLAIRPGGAGGNPHRPGGGGYNCGPPESGVVVLADEDDAAGRRRLGVAVPAAALSIEVTRAGRLLAAGPTVAGAAYTGKAAGSVRFALVRLPAGAPLDGLRVRALDGTGALVTVLASGAPDAPLVTDRRPVLAGRSGSVRWTIVSTLSSVLSSSILDLAHESVSRCVEVALHGSRGYPFSSISCASANPRDSVMLLDGPRSEAALEERCSPRFRLLHGVVPASVKAVSVLLGDGRVRAARTALLAGGEQLAYAVVISDAAAVRSVTFEQRSGARRTVPLAAAPLTVSCAPGQDDPVTELAGAFSELTDPFANAPVVTPVGPVTTIAGAPTIRVADGPGDSLCIALGDQPFTGFSCSVVSPFLGELLGAADDVVRPTAFAIVVPARVASVRITDPDGTNARSVATAPGDGYTGPYAGRVRFAVVTFTSIRQLASLELLDAAGTVLHRVFDLEEGEEEENFKPRLLGAQRVAGRRGAPSLWQTPVRFPQQSTARCLALTAGPRPPRDGRCATIRSAATVLLHASCASHRLTVAVAVSTGSRVLINTGRSRRSLALRHGAGLLTLASRSPLASLTIVRGTHTRRVAISAPSGRSQCGWSAAREIEPAISEGRALVAPVR